MEPKNEDLEEYFPFQRVVFVGLNVNFWGSIPLTPVELIVGFEMQHSESSILDLWFP